ncbi:MULTISPECIES: TetR/AcrR family transcriptional regulator [Streptacidiphilus]|uniref:TetR/AcrR family transcriptional regulator n=1 Tax=Streptacidiphilus cavernicola TaxID=3342716 RepID=A0ABV6UI32_9ACTN|nr:TetR/AcrR family transcriptional regulator [Streptacidiphilus jeojiense]
MDHQGSLRERLIDVGVELVTTEGTAALGLREIARRAGVSHGAPRRYFPTHHSLLSAIARRGFAELGNRSAAATAGLDSARDQVQAIARAYVGYALEQRGMFELMFRHDLLDSRKQESDGPRLRESSLPQFRLVVELITRHRSERQTAESERPSAPPPAVAAAALWSNLHGIAQLWTWQSLQLALDTNGSGTDPDSLDLLINAALDAHLGPADR